MTEASDETARRAEESARRAVVAVWRIESARIVATLTRYTGDFALAEDLAQDALTDALDQWPAQGVPRNGAAWLTSVGKRKAIDAWRRQERFAQRVAAMGLDLEQEQDRAADAVPWDPDEIDDDVLRLVFTACHPVLSQQARVALTLRVVAGLETTEIARAFLVPVATIQQRIVRAKQALADANVPFETPPRAERQQRLGAVLGVIYLIFTEGHAATAGEDWLRPELSREAIRLARQLVALQPEEPEVHGLLALMELTAARFPARVDAHGEPVLLADQDRRRWDRGAIRRGKAALARAESFGRGLGPYALQATIAQAHADASDLASTDWARIVAAYEGLERVAPSPIVTLNRAVAVSMAPEPEGGPAAALAIVDGLAGEKALAMGHLLPSVRGELLARLGRADEARDAFALAAERTQNVRERAVLLARAAAGR
ncbi:RNA polymerase sigma factor, sigma-70 family [Agrococcus baldri]|uniref:RNA polymerase sigma factor, sigma-70 family n=1 Tax=Agrococcus baldri TaxID=153730 RepID=A0AA94HKT8_9MICO|nr:RNA polymerase sigma factor [Agrococcus baldri]SFS02209.1 RNA polymerase sigma factor, sigma-70 family [Agrococcus baldri]